MNNLTGMAKGDFTVGIGDPPACTVGFLPPSQWRSPAICPTSTPPTGCTASCRRIHRSGSAVRATIRARPARQAGAHRRDRESGTVRAAGDAPARDCRTLRPGNLVSQGIPLDDRVTLNDNIYGPLQEVPRGRPAWLGRAGAPAAGQAPTRGCRSACAPVGSGSGAGRPGRHGGAQCPTPPAQAARRRRSPMTRRRSVRDTGR